MNETALRYLKEIVDPTISELEADPTSVRRAFLACVATFHTIDYLLDKTQNSREKFRNDSLAFATVDRVAHAFKHSKAGNENSANNQPLKSSAVIARPPARCGQMICGLSKLGDGTGGVTIAGEIGNDILQALKSAADFLRRKAEA